MLDRRQFVQGIALTGLAAMVPLRAADEQPVSTVKVLTFNILHGGRRSIEQTAEVIRVSGAGLVGIQEISESGPELAERTGLQLIEQRRGAILSRYPLLETSSRGLGAKFEIPGAGPVWLFNVHLAPAPYQPYQLAKIPYGRENPFIDTAAEAIAEAIRGRGHEAAQLLMDMAPAIRADEPVLLTGDFNEPSHLDWTSRAAEAKLCQIPVAWPTSRAVMDAGLSDVYRALFPNEVTHPGHTWTSIPQEPDVLDRIDFIYSRKMRPIAAEVIGESADHADVVVDPYPSDHRAVVATMKFE